ncbi:SPOR domain-containing protein [Shewanella sp. D64]|uniref:SPOR domain-containing protein n=1 Tax=unclassified Shewanella TaxID=196818 RepID=UPI0022BA5C70|nr:MULTISPECIES: SPOR domain-containing protein [unclassified Shewanella]MEC4725429.1 SPOR domain-containing protein [Shewanella sp. D64]MEC4738754.1 SPOR domain-containing protein [Shewanella sp. E94]WBJ95045.1 SPOR domain-containing protein [Shewanella sp. MTB7]
MSNRDYANRKPTKGKAKSTRRKSQAPAPRRFPLLLLFVTISLVGGFSYFLWNINNSSAGNTELVVVDKPNKAVVKKDPNALPPMPKEEWTYQQELENKKVEVDIPDPENAKPSRPYQMQCGSFRTLSQAEEMKAVIAFQGLSANIRKVKGTTGDWHKVSLGPYDNKRQVERERHVLQKAGINGCIILFWQGL